MRTVTTILVLALMLVPALAATYRWVDKDGNVHYSDQPHPGATQVVLPKTQTYAAPADLQVAQTAKPAAKAAPTYTSFTITSPTPGQTLWNTGGTLSVTAALEPALMKGDTVQFFYDDKPVGQPAPSLSTTLTEVYRGTHSVGAAVIGADGKARISTAAVTFYVKQHSIIKPH